MKIVPFHVQLLSVTANAARLLEECGRLCHKSEDAITETSADPFIHKLIHDLKHESVIEHASATVKVICDRGVTHEIVRHRIAAYSQESTRYVNYGRDKHGKQIKLIPMLDGLTEAQIARRMKLYEMSEAVYLAEVEEGVKPQQARDNLMTCQKTEIIITYNFREWRHFFKMRLAKSAHPQMRKVAKMIFDILVKECPAVFEDLTPLAEAA